MYDEPISLLIKLMAFLCFLTGLTDQVKIRIYQKRLRENEASCVELSVFVLPFCLSGFLSFFLFRGEGRYPQKQGLENHE